MKFSHMSLSRRLLVCFSLLAIIPVLLGGVSIWQNQSMQSRVNHLNDTALPQVIEANHIIDNSNLVTNSLQSMLLLDPEKAVALHAQQMRDATFALSGSAVRTTPLPIPGPRWPWLLGFVLIASLLWWLERRRTGGAAAQG